MKKIGYNSLTKADQALLAAAEQAVRTAYAPYSGFKVGAALLTRSGEIITGSNVENAAYGSTICAERAALLRANAMGYRRFKALAVVAGRKKRGSGIASPCGACRQMLYEASVVSGKDIRVILLSSDGKKIVITSVRELLPLPFGDRTGR